MGRAAAWLCARWERGGFIDLSKVLVTLTGARAGRQLTAALVDEAARRATPLLLPRIVTPDGLLREILGDSASEGTEVERWWAWIGAMQGISERSRRAILPRGTRPSDLVGGVRLAQMIDRTQRALAGDGVRFADVARHMEGTVDRDRWAALAELDDEYQRELNHAGLTDGTRVRLARLEQRQLRAERDVVLLGVVELSGVARRTIAAMSERTRVVALVLAPETLAKRFDDLGCVVADVWTGADLERDVGLQRRHFRVTASPMDQADAAFEAIEQWADLGGDDIVIGNMDAEVAPHLESRGAMCSVEIRRSEGSELTQTPAYRLLSAMLEYVQAGSMRGIGSLLRHEDVSAWLARTLQMPEATWLPAWDEFALQRLMTSTRDRTDEPKIVRAIIEVIHALLDVMAPMEHQSPRAVSAWCTNIARVIDELDVRADVREERGGYARVFGLLEELASARHEGMPTLCTAHEALRLIIALAQQAREPEAVRPGAIEMLGWLELVCDDSPGVVLTGFNEGSVPARGGDPLVSEAVRQALSIATADAHAARDTYLLAALAGSGRRLAIVCGRTTEKGDPLLPSRLMFACSKAEVLRRVAIWREDTATRRRPADLSAPALNGGDFGILSPDPAPLAILSTAVERYSVTSFRDYLASPYLYYLRNVMRLSEVVEPTGELDPAGFGDLIHECLAAFGRGPLATSTREREIEECLSTEIDRIVVSRFGEDMPAGVRVQREHAKGRLRAFARWQSAHAKDGWTIRHAEWSPRDGAASVSQVRGAGLEPPQSDHAGVAFDVDGKTVRLIGRIDRIDQHSDGRWLLLDYKTSAKRLAPQNTHVVRVSGEQRWVDLQLPLYRRLAEQLCGLEAGLAYVCLPAKAMETGLALAEWSADELASAEDCARHVIRRVRRGEFFELGNKPASKGVEGWLVGAGLVEEDECGNEIEEGEE